jgi:hypothetical protein
VGKSGSPADRRIMSWPWRSSSKALAETTDTSEAFTLVTCSAIIDIAFLLILICGLSPFEVFYLLVSLKGKLKKFIEIIKFPYNVPIGRIGGKDAFE